MLILLLNHYFIEKQSNKRDLVGPVSPSNFEIIFTLLSFHNISKKTKLLGAVCIVQSLLEADYIFGPK